MVYRHMPSGTRFVLHVQGTHSETFLQYHIEKDQPFENLKKKEEEEKDRKNVKIIC